MPKDELNFLEFLQSFRRGELLREANDQLEDLIRAVKDTGSKGSLTISLPFKINDAGQLECLPRVDSKPPRRALGTGIYFATDDGQLTRRDPDQSDWVEDELVERRSVRDPVS
ncbi:hypothetical protein [Roseinatronobacter sp.]